MKKKIILIAAVILLLAGGIYFLYQYLSPTYYLSFVTYRFLDANGTKSLLNVYYTNLETNEYEKVFSVPYSSSYPAAVYDLKHDCVYYSHRQLKEGELTSNDKVVRYDRSTQKNEVVLDEFYSIHDMYLRNDGSLVLLAEQEENAAVLPYLYQPDNQILTPVDLFGDTCIASFYDPYEDTFVFSGYSLKEYQAMEEAYLQDIQSDAAVDNASGAYNIENHIYLFQDDVRLVTSLQAGSIPFVAKDKDTILYGTYDGINYILQPLDYETITDGKTAPFTLDESILQMVSWNKEEEKAICLASSRSWEGLYEYDMNAKRFEKELFSDPSKSIHNAHIVKK